MEVNHSSLLPEDLLTLVWGPNIKQELFTRWSQGKVHNFFCKLLIVLFSIAGFIFSPNEKTALIQASGGPCAVIAPVQAILLKNLIKIYSYSELKEVSRFNVDIQFYI